MGSASWQQRYKSHVGSLVGTHVRELKRRTKERREDRQLYLPFSKQTAVSSDDTLFDRELIQTQQPRSEPAPASLESVRTLYSFEDGYCHVAISPLSVCTLPGADSTKINCAVQLGITSEDSMRWVETPQLLPWLRTVHHGIRQMNAPTPFMYDPVSSLLQALSPRDILSLLCGIGSWSVSAGIPSYTALFCGVAHRYTPKKSFMNLEQFVEGSIHWGLELSHEFLPSQSVGSQSNSARIREIDHHVGTTLLRRFYSVCSVQMKVGERRNMDVFNPRIQRPSVYAQRRLRGAYARSILSALGQHQYNRLMQRNDVDTFIPF